MKGQTPAQKEKSNIWYYTAAFLIGTLLVGAVYWVSQNKAEAPIEQEEPQQEEPNFPEGYDNFPEDVKDDVLNLPQTG